MAVLLQEHVKDEKKAWAKFCRRVSKVGEGRHVVASRQTTAIKGEGSTGELGETNGTETNNVPWAKESHRDFTGTASPNARQALKTLAAKQRHIPVHEFTR